MGLVKLLKRANHGCWQQWLTLDPAVESALTELFRSSTYLRWVCEMHAINRLKSSQTWQCLLWFKYSLCFPLSALEEKSCVCDYRV